MNIRPEEWENTGMKHKVVLISGKQGAGKSTLAAMLSTGAFKFNYVSSIIKFAAALYDMQEAIRGVAYEYNIPMKQKEGKLLQLLGTDWGRNCIDQNVWANACRSAVTAEIKYNEHHVYNSLILVDDLRFKNELTALDNLPFNTQTYKIRLDVNRETRKQRCDSWRDTEEHPSETDLDDIQTWDLRLVDVSGTERVVTAVETLIYGG